LDLALESVAAVQVVAEVVAAEAVVVVVAAVQSAPRPR
jgi:hypothetical protein